MIVPGGDQRHDPRQVGLPLWAHRDEGPRDTYVPGPLPTEPLTSSYGWQTRLAVAAAVVAVPAVLIVRSGQNGIASALAVLVGVYLLYAVPVWLRGHQSLAVDGDRATIRRYLREQTFTGGDVREVRYVYQGRSPDVRLVLHDGRRIYVPTSVLERGHSTLFEWLRRYAPEAAYDAKADDLRTTLTNRNLVGAPGEPASGPVRQGTEATTPKSKGEPPLVPPAQVRMGTPTDEDGMATQHTGGAR